MRIHSISNPPTRPTHIHSLVKGELRIARKHPGCAEQAQREIHEWVKDGVAAGKLLCLFCSLLLCFDTLAKLSQAMMSQQRRGWGRVGCTAPCVLDTRGCGFRGKRIQ